MSPSQKLMSEVDKIVKEFTVDEALLKELTDYFIESIELGLAQDSQEKSKALPMIPTYVTRIPTGRENGTFLAADLGGTNFRVCSVNLSGDSTFALEQSKAKIPEDLLDGTSEELFSYWPKRLNNLLKDIMLIKSPLMPKSI